MSVFLIKIESDSGEAITLGGPESPNTVTGVSVAMATLGENVYTKSNAMLAMIEVKGTLEKENSAEIIKLFNWAKDFKEASTYRKLTIQVWRDEFDADSRIYEIPQVFVTDFIEAYQLDNKKDTTVNKHGSYVLKMNQKESTMAKIKTEQK